MQLHERIELLAAVGEVWKGNLSKPVFEDILLQVENQNPWFVPRFVRQAVELAIANFLQGDKLWQWAGDLPKQVSNPLTVALVPAGNIPLVGLHDLLSVFIAGHKAQLKPSSKDKVLISYFIETLQALEPKVMDFIKVVERLANFDAVIATGSNNTNRYFESYFSKYPSLLRKNRTSVAVLPAHVDEQSAQLLADDLFMYFGLGCRSVTKLFLPQGFDLVALLRGLEGYAWLGDHHKYHNNYMYQKSVFLVNMVSHFDTGFALFRESSEINSPIGVVYYGYYDKLERLETYLKQSWDGIQVVSTPCQIDVPTRIEMGNTQNTGLFDYPDGKDILAFLTQVAH